MKSVSPPGMNSIVWAMNIATDNAISEVIGRPVEMGEEFCDMQDHPVPMPAPVSGSKRRGGGGDSRLGPSRRYRTRPANTCAKGEVSIAASVSFPFREGRVSGPRGPCVRTPTHHVGSVTRTSPQLRHDHATRNASSSRISNRSGSPHVGQTHGAGCAVTHWPVRSHADPRAARGGSADSLRDQAQARPSFLANL